MAAALSSRDALASRTISPLPPSHSKRGSAGSGAEFTDSESGDDEGAASTSDGSTMDSAVEGRQGGQWALDESTLQLSAQYDRALDVSVLCC